MRLFRDQGPQISGQLSFNVGMMGTTSFHLFVTVFICSYNPTDHHVLMLSKSFFFMS